MAQLKLVAFGDLQSGRRGEADLRVDRGAPCSTQLLGGAVSRHDLELGRTGLGEVDRAEALDLVALCDAQGTAEVGRDREGGGTGLEVALEIR